MPLVSFFLFNPYLLSTPMEIILHSMLWLLTLMEVVFSFMTLKQASDIAKSIYLSQPISRWYQDTHLTWKWNFMHYTLKMHLFWVVDEYNKHRLHEKDFYFMLLHNIKCSLLIIKDLNTMVKVNESKALVFHKIYNTSISKW